VFAWLDGRWLTPAAGTLARVTRRTVIELAEEAGQPVEEGRPAEVAGEEPQRFT
jgi:branched-subunit amino acid aminotransferase/4-amino-4-deoxychorismate lyase